MKIEISFNNQTNNLDISDLQPSECSPNRVISPTINGNANKSLSLSEPAEDKISLLLTKFDHLTPMYLVPNSQTQQQQMLASQSQQQQMQPQQQMQQQHLQQQQMRMQNPQQLQQGQWQ